MSNAVYITTSGDTLSITGETSAGSDWVFLRASFAIPTDCDRIQIQALNATNGGITQVAFIGAWPEDTYSLPLPDRVKGEALVGRVWKLAERLDVDFPETWARGEVKAHIGSTAYGGLKAVFPTRVGSAMYAYEEKTFYSALATETATTDCEDKYVCWAAAYELASSIAADVALDEGVEAAAQWERMEARMQRKAARYARLATPDSPIIIRRP